MTTITSGQTIGCWTVLDDFIKVERGQKKWLCRCECGTERYVMEKALKSGSSQSCGCLRKEAARKALTHELAGQTFGDLTVLERSGTRHSKGILWKCRCSCGNICEVPGTYLVRGHKTHCGCKTPKPTSYRADITGQRFGRLVALYPTENRNQKRSVIWHCECDCGNELDIAYCDLMYSNQQSCGCQKKEFYAQMNGMLTFVDGTELNTIKSKKIPSDNTTGYKGVYRHKDKYIAKIVFQKQVYHLGTFANIEDAHEVRKEAEEALFQSTVEYYARWQEKADSDPEWARENPVKIFVRKENGHLFTEFTPAIE